MAKPVVTVTPSRSDSGIEPYRSAPPAYDGSEDSVPTIDALWLRKLDK
jgi:hypothetical protein